MRRDREPADLVLGGIVEVEQPVRLGDRCFVPHQRGGRGTLARPMLQPVRDHPGRCRKRASVAAAAPQVERLDILPQRADRIGRGRLHVSGEQFAIDGDIRRA